MNRDCAISDDGVVERGLTGELAVKMKDGFKPVRWKLDLQRGLATPDKPGDHLKSFSVPVRPMLACVATAPGPTNAAGTGDSGRFGGNMDFNEIVEGATVYLPVNVPGALLYLGDGHALQGDDELNGNALETSMDVEVTVDVISQNASLGRAWSRPPTSWPWDSTARWTGRFATRRTTWPDGSSTPTS
jgi:amidase